MILQHVVADTGLKQFGGGFVCKHTGYQNNRPFRSFSFGDTSGLKATKARYPIVYDDEVRPEGTESGNEIGFGSDDARGERQAGAPQHKLLKLRVRNGVFQDE